MKFKFDHSKQSMAESLGISQEEVNEITKIVSATLRKSLKEGCLSTSNSRVIEQLSIINPDNPKMMAVAYMAGVMVVKVMEDT